MAVMLIGILHCIPDQDDPAGIVARLMAAVPAGSYLTISHPARDINTTQTPRLASRLNELMPNKLTVRTRPDVESYFAGLDLVDPGIVRIPDWRPDAEADRANPAAVWGGVARKS